MLLIWWNKMKEKIEFAFKLIEMELKQILEKDNVEPFKIVYMITDFENKKDYELILELKEVKV